MEYRPLGQTGLEVSSIGLGCVTFGREIDKATSFDVLDHALERGINLLDTAEAYAAGESERVVGEWMADRGVRDRVVLATKVSGTLTRERVITSAEESLQRLGVDVIDLFQLHVFDDSTPWTRPWRPSTRWWNRARSSTSVAATGGRGRWPCPGWVGLRRGPPNGIGAAALQPRAA
ncbi:MAG: hypothetical protein Ct9H300mP1_18330 [Planctomycetaceae bacterium]|nr:MAG: hypothetical protein Ct9H300mP1_18330 [Planctomycetaceae bacterium]